LSALAAAFWWHLADIRLAAPWFAFAAAVGFLVALAAFVLPAWREATQSTVAAARAEIGRAAAPLWQRLYLDVALLALGAIVFWGVARTGYQIVLAPEGVPQTSVHYEAFLAPVLMWIGAGLLWVRLGELILGRGRRAVTAAVTPLAGDLAPLVAASLSRQKRRIAGGVALVSLAFAFATATAIFNTTYDAQARVDAELTNGSDVTVTGTAVAPAGQLLPQLRKIPGVTAAQPLMHRFAYVGTDLQDIFGIDAAHITDATTLSNAYFANHDAAKTLQSLQATPDGILVSEETVKDFQLQPGDTVNLRLQSAADRQYRAVPFKFIGVTREFPTAPKDSFLVANAAYVARQTGSDAAEVVLLRTSGNNEAVAQAARRAAAPLAGAKVTTLGEAQAIISSSLTAVDLGGLTRLELAFSILMIAGVTGLVLGLGLAERRRGFTILSALGAKPRQVGAFLWSEGLFVVIGGAVLGIATGFGIAQVLVTILAGAFDPPPEALSIPWTYLGFALATALACGAVSIVVMRRLSARPDLGALRGS
jgi:putative ABC transport system permease protein